MKKFFAVLLAGAMVLGLAACGGPSPKEQVLGSWDASVDISEEEWNEDLVNLEFYEDEIALADLSALKMVRTITFNEDDTYTEGKNDEKSLEAVKTTLKEFFAVLYDNRATIEEYYGGFDDCASVEEFIDLYAQELFSYDNGDAMIDKMAGYVNELYSVEAEEGEYKISSKQIDFKVQGMTEYEYAEYTLDGNNLTIEYKNGATAYSR